MQVALPRKLNPEQRQELARETARELLGNRFAYTLAVHTPLAKDNIDQPHLHLMFSERAVTDATRELAEERFFKRNGAKKDPAWNDRNQPEEVRAKWVEMMNGAMQKAGIDRQLHPRSWAEQGREDLAELREEKTLQGDGREARERNEERSIPCGSCGRSCLQLGLIETRLYRWSRSWGSGRLLRCRNVRPRRFPGCVGVTWGRLILCGGAASLSTA